MNAVAHTSEKLKRVDRKTRSASEKNGSDVVRPFLEELFAVLIKKCPKSERSFDCLSFHKIDPPRISLSR